MPRRTPTLNSTRRLSTETAGFRWRKTTERPYRTIGLSLDGTETSFDPVLVPLVSSIAGTPETKRTRKLATLLLQLNQLLTTGSATIGRSTHAWDSRTGHPTRKADLTPSTEKAELRAKLATTGFTPLLTWLFEGLIRELDSFDGPPKHHKTTIDFMTELFAALAFHRYAIMPTVSPRLSSASALHPSVTAYGASMVQPTSRPATDWPSASPPTWPADSAPRFMKPRTVDPPPDWSTMVPEPVPRLLPVATAVEPLPPSAGATEPVPPPGKPNDWGQPSAEWMTAYMATVAGAGAADLPSITDPLAAVGHPETGVAEPVRPSEVSFDCTMTVIVNPDGSRGVRFNIDHLDHLNLVPGTGIPSWLTLRSGGMDTTFTRT